MTESKFVPDMPDISRIQCRSAASVDKEVSFIGYCVVMKQI